MKSEYCIKVRLKARPGGNRARPWYILCKGKRGIKYTFVPQSTIGEDGKPVGLKLESYLAAEKIVKRNIRKRKYEWKIE